MNPPRDLLVSWTVFSRGPDTRSKKLLAPSNYLLLVAMPGAPSRAKTESESRRASQTNTSQKEQRRESESRLGKSPADSAQSAGRLGTPAPADTETRRPTHAGRLAPWPPSSFLLLVVRPGAPSSVLAPRNSHCLILSLPRVIPLSLSQVTRVTPGSSLLTRQFFMFLFVSVLFLFRYISLYFLLFFLYLCSFILFFLLLFFSLLLLCVFSAVSFLFLSVLLFL